MGEHQGLLDGEMTSLSSMSWTALLASSLFPKGILQGTWRMGWLSPVWMLCRTRLVRPWSRAPAHALQCSLSICSSWSSWVWLKVDLSPSCCITITNRVLSDAPFPGATSQLDWPLPLTPWQSLVTTPLTQAWSPYAPAPPQQLDWWDMQLHNHLQERLLHWQPLLAICHWPSPLATRYPQHV